MNIFQSIILGFIEGLTEFLPISSTGHLIVVSHWLGLEQTDSNKAFEVIIQLAAILAVVANYKERFSPKYVGLWTKVALSFVPVGIVGLLFHDQIKSLFSVPVVAIMFIVGGVIFLLLEKYIANKPPSVEDINQVSYKQSLIIGIAQVFALIPGTSRAGSTIVGALLVGLSRKASAEFSFLLALPVMVAASGLDLISHYNDFANESFLPLMAGFFVAFVTAYLVIKLFIRFLDNFTFVAFGWYRIVFGILLLLMY
ncbi:MAG TPA: undecaprenyl-diphosphate phosphatase [Methylophaga aminisulfidivorans]|uniref:Undecaprenyl-diphosphatase n=1 Tax=Methylophaga aminisulfidivorans TaxID=230105 RepID=A0A7C1W1I9_9GAMM|nr:undecaprenyl-diphosphate phosphatase [Methylophaga aminisulfidivorans]